MSPKRLSRVIRNLRDAKHMSQRALNGKAKVTPGYIGQLEMGRKTNPSLALLQRLAQALGVPLIKLLR